MSELVTTEQIAQPRITLEGIELAIWRQVEVPLTAPLNALHDVIQAAFGWEGYHLHLFEVAEVRYGVPDPVLDSLYDGLAPKWACVPPLPSSRTSSDSATPATSASMLLRKN